MKRSPLEKLNRRITEEEEATDTSSNGDFDTLISIWPSKELFIEKHKHTRVKSVVN